MTTLQLSKGTKAEGKAPGKMRDRSKAPVFPDVLVAKERPPPFAEELWACIHCNYCSAECPTAREVGWESTTPRGKIRMFRDLVDRWHPKRGVDVSETFLQAAMSVAQEPLADCFSAGSLHHTLGGVQVRSGSPIEIEAAIWDIGKRREAARRVGCPGKGMYTMVSAAERADAHIAAARP